MQRGGWFDLLGMEISACSDCLSPGWSRANRFACLIGPRFVPTGTAKGRAAPAAELPRGQGLLASITHLLDLRGVENMGVDGGMF